VLRPTRKWFGPFPFEKLTGFSANGRPPDGHSPASFVVLKRFAPLVDGLLVPNPDSPVDLARWRESSWPTKSPTNGGAGRRRVPLRDQMAGAKGLASSPPSAISNPGWAGRL